MKEEKHNVTEEDITGTSGTAKPTGGRWEVNVSSSYADAPVPASEPEEAPPADIPPAPIMNSVPPTGNGLPAWVKVLAIIGVFIASSFVAQIVQVIVGKNPDSDPAFGQFISYTITLGLTILFTWWIMTRREAVKRLLGFSLKRTNPTLILWGLVLVIVTSMVLEPLLAVFPSEYLDFLKEAVGSGGWAMLTTIIAAPILEEILFRGFLQQELTGEYGRIKGLLLASAVFGIIHILPQQAINAFFMGIILGYIYIRSGSLVPAIIIHAINNAIAYTFMQLFGDSFTFTKDVFGNEVWFWVVYAGCCVIFLFAGWNLMRELRKLDRIDEENAPAAG